MSSSQFHLPQDPQISSPLFRLPYELRLFIYGHLLTQDKVIASTARANRRDAGYYKFHKIPNTDSLVNGSMCIHELVQRTQRVKPELCPQILGSCQRLRQEGLPIFCEENRLEILWTPVNTGFELCLTRYCYDVFDGSKSCSVDPEIYQIDNDELNMHSASSALGEKDNKAPYVLLDIPYLDLQAQQLQRLTPIISRFKKFHLRVELLCWMSQGLLIMCRELRHILEGCDVTIDTRDVGIISGQEYPFMVELWLRYFRIMRLKSLTFLGRSELTLDLDCEFEVVDELVRLVTSNEPVQDTFRMWQSLLTFAYVPGSTEPCYKLFKDKMLSLSVYKVCKYNMQKFEAWRDEAFEDLRREGFDGERLRQLALENSQAWNLD